MKAAPAAANSDIPIGSRPQAQNPQTFDFGDFYINLEALPKTVDFLKDVQIWRIFLVFRFTTVSFRKNFSQLNKELNVSQKLVLLL